MLKKFSRWLPVALVALSFYGLVFVGAIWFLLTQYTELEKTREIAISTGILLLSISLLAYLSYITRTLSSYRLEIDKDEVLVHGLAGWKFVTARFAIPSLNAVTVGESLNAFEKFCSLSNRKAVSALADQKKGKLIVSSNEGKSLEIYFVDKAFCHESLDMFLVELVRRGVSVSAAT